MGEGGPGAATAADVGVVARAAEAVELTHGELAIVREGVAVAPDRLEGALADIAFDEGVDAVAGGREREAALDVAVALDADHGAAGGAADPEGDGAAAIAHVGLDVAEVAHVMAGEDLGALGIAA